MENNKLILEIDGKEKEYRVLLNVENVEGKNYVIYTADEKKDEDTLVYAAEYELIDNKPKIKSIKDDKKWEFIKDLLNSLQNIGEE